MSNLIRKSALSLLMVVTASAQTVFIPGGTGGIGSSSTSNVGVGTAAATEKLEVSGGNILVSGVVNPFLMLKSSATGTPYGFLQYDQSEGNFMRLYDGSQYSMVWRAGKVGIGTATPEFPLNIAGHNSSVQLRLERTNTSQGIFDIGADNSGLTFYPGGYPSSGSSKFFIGSSGNVGIGTTGPNGKLTIDAAAGSVPADGLVRIGNTDYSSQTNNIMLSVAPGVVNVDAPGIVGGRFKIDAAGNVGIGTINPSARLHLKGVGAATQLFIEDANLSTNWQIGTNTGAGGNTHTFSIYSNEFGPSNSYLPLLQLTATNGSILLAPGLGNVGIGTTNPTSKLAVNGTIRAKEVIVDTGWSDFVFDDDYQLAPLTEVEAHIKEKKHLPGIPSAAEVEAGGVSLGDMQARLLAKVEELTLHLIEIKKENAAHSARLASLEKENQELLRQISSVTANP